MRQQHALLGAILSAIIVAAIYLFEFAGVMDTRSTMKLKGTLLYMSPEQTELRPLTPRSDLFSLAVVTYEALAGRRPFEGANAEQIIRAIRTELQPPISEIRPEVSESMSQLNMPLPMLAQVSL